MKVISNNNNQKLEKLQKEIEQLQKDINLEQQQSELIKNYKMIEGKYKIIITVYQANDLQPRGEDLIIYKPQKTACDAFVEVTVRDQVKKTQIRQATNNPIFDQQLYFDFDKLTIQELDRSKITFNVYDKQKLFMTSLIGVFQLDWTNVYFKRNHQIYRGWLTLTDPNDQFQGIVGYLLVNIAVLGPDDKITVHDSAFIKDPLTTIEDTITSPKIKLIDFCISIEIYRAEHLVPVDKFQGVVDAYVIAKFSGNKIQTSVKSNHNPQWSQILKIGTGVPTKSKYITLEVRNRNRLLGDDIIGVIKIPFADLCDQNYEQVPVWGNIYGPPISGKDKQPLNMATKMQVYGDTMGSHYRGKLFYKISGKKDIFTKNIKTKLKFKFPYQLTPVVPFKTYNLQIDLIQAFGVPSSEKFYIQACIGQYIVCSKSYKTTSKSCNFFQSLQQKKISFPQIIDQVPDLILYFCLANTDEQHRICFVRIKAKDIVSEIFNQKTKIYEFKIDKSLYWKQSSEIGGYITARINLFKLAPPSKRAKIPQFYQKLQKHHLSIFLYQGEGFPVANQRGDCDPMLKFSVNGSQQFYSNPVMNTYNPIWKQVVKKQIQIQDLLEIPLEKGIVCDALDYQQNGNHNYIGSFMIKLNNSMKKSFKYKENHRINFIYSKPQWHYIINPNILIGQNAYGRVLISVALFKNSNFKEIEQCTSLNKIKIQQQKNTIDLYVIGIRDYESRKSFLQNQKFQMSIKVSTSQPQIINDNTIKNGLKHGGCQIHKMLQFKTEIAKNKYLTPYMQIKMSIPDDKIMGYNSINLFKIFPKLLKKQATKNGEIQQQQEEDDTLFDIDELYQQIQQLKLKKQNEEKMKKKQKQNLANLVNAIFNLQKKVQQDLQATKNLNLQQEVQLDRLLKNFQNQFEKTEQYDYVKILQQQKDNLMRSSLKNKDKNVTEKKKGFGNITLGEYGFNKQQNDNQNESFLQQSRGESNFKESKIKTKTGLSLQLQNTTANLIKNQPNNSQFKKAITLNDSREIQMHGKQITERFGKIKKKDEEVISNFNIDQNQSFSQNKPSEKAIKYKNIQKALMQQNKDQKQALEREEQYKYAAAVKLTLFGWQRDKQQPEKQTYQDYDTDQDENLDIIPEWYKGRKILLSDFQDIFLEENKKIFSVPIYKGLDKKQQNLNIRIRQQIATLKIFAICEKTSQKAKQKQRHYQKLLKPKKFFCRIYVLKGKSLISEKMDKPTTYLKFTYGGSSISLKDKTLVKQQNNPQYYICHEFPVQLPGPSSVRIDVIQHKNIFGRFTDKTLGYTQIDLQERYFTKKWHFFQKKPIQLRNLKSEYGIGTQGRLQTWIQLIQKSKWVQKPPQKISPPPFDQFQLRVIVWQTKNCVYKNTAMQSNDIFVRGHVGKEISQETDVHWACRTVGSFNYRFKYKVFYPPKPEDMYSDIFFVQIWDKDVIGYDNLIGEAKINLNKVHKLIQKAVKRKKPVNARMQIIQKNLSNTDRFWFDVYNHKQKDQFGQLKSQGKVQLSFELVPIKTASTQRVNGFGRAQPNVYPTLAQPSGRLNFNFLHPFQFLQQLLGPNLYKSLCYKLCCCLVLVIIIVFVLLLGLGILSNAIV